MLIIRLKSQERAKIELNKADVLDYLEKEDKIVFEVANPSNNRKAVGLVLPSIFKVLW